MKSIGVIPKTDSTMLTKTIEYMRQRINKRGRDTVYQAERSPDRCGMALPISCFQNMPESLQNESYQTSANKQPEKVAWQNFFHWHLFFLLETHLTQVPSFKTFASYHIFLLMGYFAYAFFALYAF